MYNRHVQKCQGSATTEPWTMQPAVPMLGTKVHYSNTSIDIGRVK
jgi:hypothetical protein